MCRNTLKNVIFTAAKWRMQMWYHSPFPMLCVDWLEWKRLKWKDSTHMGTKADITEGKTFAKAKTTTKNLENIKWKTNTMGCQRNTSKQAINSIYRYHSMPDLIHGPLRPGDLRVLCFVGGFHHSITCFRSQLLHIQRTSQQRNWETFSKTQYKGWSTRRRSQEESA